MTGEIDTVIFDMDGVIFDSEALVLNAWKEVTKLLAGDWPKRRLVVCLSVLAYSCQNDLRRSGER